MNNQRRELNKLRVQDVTPEQRKAADNLSFNVWKRVNPGWVPFQTPLSTSHEDFWFVQKIIIINTDHT